MKSTFSVPSDNPGLTRAENFNGAKSSFSSEKNSKSTHLALPSNDPVTPRIETTSLESKRLNSDLGDSEIQELELSVSQRAHACVVVEPLFNPTSITRKAPLRARDNVKKETPSPETLESDVGDVMTVQLNEAKHYALCYIFV